MHIFKNFGMTFKYDAKIWDVKRDLLRSLKEVPISFWEEVEEYIRGYAKELTAEIKGARVAPSTEKQRKKLARLGIGVETYKGTFKVPNANARVGDRTGTFLSDFSNLSPPGVEISYARDSYSLRLKNGTFLVKILVDQFSRTYPIWFQKYLINRGLVSDRGFMDLTSDEHQFAMIALIRKKIIFHVTQKFGSYPGK